MRVGRALTFSRKFLGTNQEIYQKRYRFDDRRSVIQAISERLHRERDSFIPGKDLDEKLHQIAEYAYDLLDKGERECDLEAGFLRFLLAAYVGGLRMKIKEIKSSGNGNKEESPETLEFDA